MAKTSSKIRKKQPPVKRQLFRARKGRKAAKTETRSEANASKTARGWRKVGRKVKMKTKGAVRRVNDFRAQHLHLHRSFRRSYREDYLRPTETPGLLSHAMLTFKMIFSHWRVFLPFIMLLVVLYILAVGLMTEEFYQEFQTSIDATSDELASGDLGYFAKAGLLLASTVTSGGLQAGMGESQTIFGILLFLISWLVTIFLVRHFLANKAVRLRDGLYNALSPLLSTLVVFAVAFMQAIPIILVIITYSAAIMTDFLTSPFYALVYFIFAISMLLLSGYMLSSTLLALVATAAPGVYPLAALMAASDLIASRRMRFILRVLYLGLVVALIYIVTMLPIIMLDLWLKSMWSWLAGWPIVPFFMLIVTCFVFVYLATYLYMYYRWLLEQKEK